MADQEILNRIDDHMARGNELMARFIELHEDNRRFTRELLRRNEIVIHGITSEMREFRAEFRTEMAAGRQILIDLHEESVAQRQAILTVIDELREHGLGGRG